jgi:hypothetical protein
MAATGCLTIESAGAVSDLKWKLICMASAWGSQTQTPLVFGSKRGTALREKSVLHRLILASVLRTLWASSSWDACVSSRLQSRLGVVQDKSRLAPPTNGSQLCCDDGKLCRGNSTRQDARGVFRDGIGKYGSFWKTAALYWRPLSCV